MKQSYYEREPKATQQDLFVHHVFTKNYFFWLLHEKCVQEKAKFSSSNYNIIIIIKYEWETNVVNIVYADEMVLLGYGQISRR